MARIAWRALIALLYLFLLAPILIVFVISFDTRRFISFPPQQLSLATYGAVLHNALFIRAFLGSLLVGVLVAALALLAGTLLAFALARLRFRGRGLVSLLAMAPLLVPHIVLALGLLIVFAPLDLIDSWGGIVLAHAGITIPYVVRTVSAALATLDIRIEEAARVHGASGLAVFRRITLPLIRPGLLAGAVMAFLISFDEATISLFIVGNRVSLLPVEIYRYIQYRTDPQVAAVSVFLVLISVALVMLVERGVGLRRALRA